MRRSGVRFPSAPPGLLFQALRACPRALLRNAATRGSVMGVLTNVFRRGGVFYFRARVPAALRPSVGRRELWRSLRTSDPTEARCRGASLLRLTEALWRDLHPRMSPNEIQSLIDNWTKAKLEEDADARLTGSRDALEAHHA